MALTRNRAIASNSCLREVVAEARANMKKAIDRTLPNAIAASGSP